MHEIRNRTLKVAQAGRENLVELLQHLREIERRRLFSGWGFQSLFDYVVRELKFSEAEAQRRISTMRLMRDVPSILAGLRDGSLNLTNLCMVQALAAKEKKAGHQFSKSEFVEHVRNKSSRQAAKIVSEVNPEMSRTKELTFYAIENERLREKLIRMKGVYAHVDPNMSLEELLERMCDDALEPKSPSAPKVDSVAEIKRRVWRRDQGRCCRCGSTHALEYDHIQPTAAGGETKFENLRLLCKNCNLRAAMDFYGEVKMGSYVRDSHRPYVVKNYNGHQQRRRRNYRLWDTIDRMARVQ